MKQDNRGITLVELMIAITISVVIMGAAAYFMGQAQKSFQYAKETIDLQMESQVLMDQLSSWIMEGNGVKISGNALIIYQIPRNTDTPLPDGVTKDTAATKRIIWESDGKLYMKVVDGITDAAADTTVVTAADATSDRCIGDYVKEFTPVFTTGVGQDRKKSVQITFKMESGKQQYTMENEVMLRNEWRLA